MIGVGTQLPKNALRKLRIRILLRFGRGGGDRTHVRTLGLVNVPTSLPRGQDNLRPERAFSTVLDNHWRKVRRVSTLSAQQHNRKPFSNSQPNPQNAMSCATYAVFGSPRVSYKLL
jgi:hypothetical protein